MPLLSILARAQALIIPALWLLLIAPNAELQEAPAGSGSNSTEPRIIVAEDLVILENEVSAPIPITFSPDSARPLSLLAKSTAQDLLPDDQVVIIPSPTGYTLKMVPALNAKGATQLLLTAAFPNQLSVAKTLQIVVVPQGPTILSQPSSLTTEMGSSVSFVVRVKGSAPLRYQWQRDGSDLPGQTQAELTLQNTRVDQAGRYSVTVANPQGNVTSAVAVLQVIANPTIISEPVDQTASVGGNASFTVVPSGPGPFRFQWRKNGSNLPGQTAATLSLPALTPASAGLYSVLVQGPTGVTTTRPAMLTVLVPQVELADAMELAVLLPQDQGSLRASTRIATAQPGEPTHAGHVASRSLWARWVAPADGVMRMNTTGSSFDTFLAAYLGSSLASLDEQASDDDVGGSFTSAIAFTARKGQEFRIAVDGPSSASSVLSLSWSFEPGALPVPRILADPLNRVVQPGGFTLVEVEAEGVEAYQWELNASDVPGGITPRWRVRSATPSDAGNYQVKLSNGREVVFSQKASLQLGPDPKVASKDKFFEPILLGEPVLPSSKAALGLGSGWKHGGAAAASGFRGTQVFSSIGATTEVGEPNLCGIIGGASQWFTYQAPASGALVVTTEGSNFDTVLGVFTGPGDSFESLQLLACDNNSGADGKTSRAKLNVVKGQTYFIGVDGVDGASGNVHLNYLFETPARLTSARPSGDQVRFELSGAAGVNYQIQASFNLVAWETLGTTNSPTGLFTISESRSGQRRFFRLIPAP